MAASEAFRGSPQLVAFLRYVVEATLRGEQDRIKGYTIAVEALGRADDFDPQTDPIVRVEAMRLRRALNRYYANGGKHDPVVIDLPLGSYVPVFRRVRARCRPARPAAVLPAPRAVGTRRAGPARTGGAGGWLPRSRCSAPRQLYGGSRSLVRLHTRTRTRRRQARPRDAHRERPTRRRTRPIRSSSSARSRRRASAARARRPTGCAASCATRSRASTRSQVISGAPPADERQRAPPIRERAGELLR